MEREIWRKVFLEITLRAMRKVHLSHAPWELGKVLITEDDLPKLNDGYGVLLALETTVASEISNEFIYSSFTSGMKFQYKNEEPKPKYYEIQREKQFTYKNKKLFKGIDGDINTKQVDLVLRRWDEQKQIHNTLIIMELKRYNLYSFDISTGRVTPKGSNINEIKRDLKNLGVFKDKWEILKVKDYSEHTTCTPYMLIWGEANMNQAQSLLSDFKTNFNIEDTKVYIKWMPLTIVEMTRTQPIVTEWLWIALLEI
jgi:hypothetical protein